MCGRPRLPCKEMGIHPVSCYQPTCVEDGQCEYEDLGHEQTRRKKWIKPGTVAHNALNEIVMHKSLQKDLGQLCKFIHTGKLEVFHSLLHKCSPKRQEFDFLTMQARTQLAIMDHNHNVQRKQAEVQRSSSAS